MGFGFKYIQVLLLLLTAYMGLGQAHFLHFAGGLRPEALRDAGYSPLQYSGRGFTGMLAFQRKSVRKETIWIAHYGKSSLVNMFDRNMQTTAAGILNFNFYFSEGSERKLRWGWANNNQFHTRRIDDFQNFNGRTDFFTSFGPAIHYSLPFEWEQQRFSFDVMGHVQAIGFYVASGYVSSVPPGFAYESYGGLQGLLRSANLFYPGSAFNAAFLPSLQWNLKSGNSIGMTYWYEYTQLEKAHRSVRSVGHWFFFFKMRL
jgi:hypothetical protein